MAGIQHLYDIYKKDPKFVEKLLDSNVEVEEKLVITAETQPLRAEAVGVGEVQDPKRAPWVLISEEGLTAPSSLQN